MWTECYQGGTTLLLREIGGITTYYQETMRITEEGNTFFIKGKGGVRLKYGKWESRPLSNFTIWDLRENCDVLGLNT